MEMADRTRLMSAIEPLDERTLDYLAVELRTPSYDDSFPIETKRELIAGTLPFYATLGTPAAVDWIIQAIFGSGHIEEWFEYDGDPHHFRVFVGESGKVSVENLVEFQRVLNSVKRLSSWLDEIEVVKNPMVSELYLGGAFGTQLEFPVPKASDEMKWFNTLQAGGVLALASVLPVPEMT